ncbi:SPS1 Serine/threonine protein kinase, partial [Pyrenophora tritici-repentis]
MVMLDLGSITIRDGEGIPVSHSIIFELATFSLGDFPEMSTSKSSWLDSYRLQITDNIEARAQWHVPENDFLKTEKAEKRRKTSVLFAKLADLVKALEHLHRDLDLLHLDIKPDNILVFEGEPSNQDNEKEDEEKLLWKLSDFGLARKKRDKARVGLGGHYWHSSYQESRSSNISATRPAGVYQAPEVQQPGSSGVGKRSDVWSMGCVTLMVLAFATYSVPGVKELESQLFVKFKHWGGSQSLFYHRSDSYLWGAELLS